MEKRTEEELMELEDRCRKAIKTVTKAIFMRVFITVLLIWALLQTDRQLWIIGLIGLVVLLNLGGMFPLLGEWKKRRRELVSIMDQYE